MRKQVVDSSSIIRIQSWHPQTAAPWKVEYALGIVWPHQTGAAVSGHADIICVSPTDWLMISADTDAALLVQRLTTAFAGSSFSASDVSQALLRIQIDGPYLRDLLAKGCSLDLHPPLFPPGRSARTRFAGMPVIVRCTGTSTFELIITQSYADFLLSWLEDAELEFEIPT
jgi:sarcosine oxidase, subunit gamma